MFQCDINVTSGIRQGCNASSNLFLLITYCIIEKLYDNLSGVNTNICKIVALFFADDGMILMQSLRETKESIQVLMNIAEECGMNINKDKSNIMIFNHKEKIHEATLKEFKSQTQLTILVSQYKTKETVLRSIQLSK